MMHTRLVYGDEPKINDEYIEPIPPDERPGLDDKRAYGAYKVRQLAKRQIRNGGGATRASTNADSYAMVANALYWWRITSYFPDPPKKTAVDGFPLFVDMDLGDVTDIRTVNFDDLFSETLSTYGAMPDDEDDLPDLLQLTGTPGELQVAGGTDLRILTVGDSITVGYLSNQDGGDGNGYRLKLRDDLSRKLTSNQ
jgi:hypothetical protein